MIKIIKNYLNFSARERMGILSLLCLIIIVKCIPAFFPAEPIYIDPKITAELKLKLEAALQEETDMGEEKPASDYSSFNPNEISKEEWISLGVPEKIAFRINNYISSGHKFQKPSDLKKIYGFPAPLFEKLKDRLRIEPLAEAEKHYTKPVQSVKPRFIELNSADSASLEKLPGLGAYTVRKILQYRERLGGFVQKEQILEIKNINPDNYEKFKDMITVNGKLVRQLKLNVITAAELSRHPYISRRQAEAIISYREQHGQLMSAEILSKMPLFKNEELARLLPYLSFD